MDRLLKEFIRSGEELMYKLKRLPGEVILIPDGDIISPNVMQMKEKIIKLIAKDNKLITIDLLNVEVMDSSGIGAFILVKQSIAEMDGQLKFINVSTDIQKMFKVMCLDKYFEVVG